MVELKLDWCSYKAAKYAVEHWHYSKCMPVGKKVNIGVWEDNKYIGVIIYSLGSCANIGKPFGLKQFEICELTRVALNKHKNTVTKIIKISIKLLLKIHSNLKLIVSYADENQNHLGKIYQAGNWLYIGECGKEAYTIIKNKKYHGRSVFAKYGTRSINWLKENVDKNAKRVYLRPKHKYIYPIKYNIINIKIIPYPKQIMRQCCKESISTFQDGGGGAIPTLTLQNK